MRNKKKQVNAKERLDFEDLLFVFVKYIMRTFKIKDNDGVINSTVQFLKFGIVGVTNTLVSYVINILVLKALASYHWEYDYVVANLVAFIISVFWSFYWNNKFVFSIENGKKRNLLHTLLKTYIAYSMTGVVMTNILSYFWIDIIGISKYIAPIINLIICVPINFLLNKKWAYKS